MLIVPVGREQGSLQRQAWITWSLAGLNVVFFLLFCTGPTDRERSELIRSWRSTITYLRERPYLRLPVHTAPLMPKDLRDRAPRPDPSVPDWKRWKEQNEVDAMAAGLVRLYAEVDDVRMAYVPAVGSWWTLFTSMFLHGGLMHLIGNLLFLLAVAPFVEDAFGRPLFLVLYVSAGVVATLAFGAMYPDLVVPLVGASGAIAGVMGAYLVRFALSRLEFLFIPILFLPMWNFRFAAPALVVLPLWFLEQIVSIPMEGGSGVAVTAHVAGFVYGLAFAVLLRLSRVEKKIVQPSIAKQTSWKADPRLDRALAAFAMNDAATTRRELAPVLAEQPSNPDALRLGLDLALFQDETATIDGYGARLLSAYAEHRDADSARRLILELEPLAADRRMPQFLSRAASFAERTGDRPLAISLYERLCDAEAATANVIPSLVKLATLRRSKGDVGGAKEALGRALDHPQCSPEWRRKIDHTMSMIASG